MVETCCDCSDLGEGVEHSGSNLTVRIAQPRDISRPAVVLTSSGTSGAADEVVREARPRDINAGGEERTVRLARPREINSNPQLQVCGCFQHH